MVSKSTSTVQYPYPLDIKKMWHPHYRYPNGIKKIIIKTKNKK